MNISCSKPYEFCWGPGYVLLISGLIPESFPMWDVQSFPHCHDLSSLMSGWGGLNTELGCGWTLTRSRVLLNHTGARKRGFWSRRGSRFPGARSCRNSNTINPFNGEQFGRNLWQFSIVEKENKWWSLYHYLSTTKPITHKSNVDHNVTGPLLEKITRYCLYPFLFCHFALYSSKCPNKIERKSFLPVAT